MIRNKLNKLILTLFVASTFSITVFATDGYFRHGYGIKYSALAGSGVAVSLSSLGAISNPAGIVFLDSDRYDFNISYFSPSREYTVTGDPSLMQGTFPLTPETVKSDGSSFFFPTLGANWMLNPTMAIGLVIYGNGGMNTEYPAQVFYDPGSPKTGVNLEQLFAGVTYAIEIAEGHSLAAQGLFGWQRFTAQGLASFSMFSSDTANLTGNAKSISTGFGFKVGYQGKIGKMFRIGASYQSKMNMSEYERYAGLFAEKGGFDVPANWQAGIAVTPSKALTILFDVQQILYSGVKSVANKMDLVNNSPMLPTGPNPDFKPLGDPEGWGFGWEDMTIIKFGLMYKLQQNWVLYGGYSYGQQPIPESEVLFNILAPAVVESHITLGVSKAINKSNEIMVAFMYAPEGSVTGPNPLEAPNQQTIELKMNQFQIDIGYGFNVY
ncbi:OmpP1/FadL family transporter [Bacteroidota bacterium]